MSVRWPNTASAAASSNTPSSSATTTRYEVLTLYGNVVSLSLPSDALLLTLLQRATPNETPAVRAHLRLCCDDATRSPDLLSLISAEVGASTSISDFVTRQHQPTSGDCKRFSVQLLPWDVRRGLVLYRNESRSMSGTAAVTRLSCCCRGWCNNRQCGDIDDLIL